MKSRIALPALADGATPACVSLELASSVIPVVALPATAMFSVVSFAAATRAVSEMFSSAPPTVKLFVIAATSPRAVRTLPAHTAAVSFSAMATVVASGVPPSMSAEVTVTVMSPLEVAVPAATAVSIWTVPEPDVPRTSPAP